MIRRATAGVGGIGMRVCEDEAAVAEAFAAVTRLAGSNFSDGGVFLERYVRQARHIEVQVFGDGQGHVVALGERDCSLRSEEHTSELQSRLKRVSRPLLEQKN